MSERTHVRFKEGENLVEYEGSSSKSPAPTTKKEKNRSEKLKRSASISGAIHTDSAPTSTKQPSTKRSKTKESAGEDTSTVSQTSAENVGSAEKATPVTTAGIADTDKEKPIDELKLKLFSSFQTINRVHGGAIMKIKTGVAGVTPSKDSFPMFGGIKRWTCLHWDAETVPASWCLAWYMDAPDWFTHSLNEVTKGVRDNASESGAEETNDVASHGSGNSSPVRTPPGPTLVQSSLFPLPAERLAVKVIRISDVSEIFLEASPSASFRIYCGKEVIQLTPLTSYNVLSRRSACWADALYSMMALQGEGDPELVLLYKQEFIQLLQQAETVRLEQQQQQQQQHQVLGNGVPSTARPRSPMRRRSTLSNLLGIGPSKPLEGSDTADWRASEAPAEEGSPTASAKSPKLTLKGAVKLLQRQLSFTSNTIKTNRESMTDTFNRPWLLDKKGSVVKFRPAPMYGQDGESNGGYGGDASRTGAAGTVEADHEDSKQDAPSGGQGEIQRQRPPMLPGGSLSQSVLGTAMARSGSPRSAGSGDAQGAAVAEVSVKSGTVEQLQARIDELLVHNRELQEKLRGSGRDAGDAAHTDASPTAVRPDRRPAPPPGVRYNSENSFTLGTRGGLGSNAQQALKNSKRAFSQPGLGPSAQSGHSVAWHTRQPHGDTGDSRGRPVSPSARSPSPVLGRRTVLDALLARGSAVPPSLNAGDDYYNDTIELEPQQMEQLVELHRLQQLRLAAEGRRDQAVNTEPEGRLELSDSLAPAPGTERRRREDSTTAIPPRRVSVRSPGEGALLASTASVGPDRASLQAQHMESEARSWPDRSVLGAPDNNLRPRLNSSGSIVSVPKHSMDEPAYGEPALPVADAAHSVAKIQPAVPSGRVDTNLTLVRDVAEGTAAIGGLTLGSRDKLPHTAYTASLNAPGKAAATVAPAFAKEAHNSRPGADKFSANERQVILTHEREVKLQGILTGGVHQTPSVGEGREQLNDSKARSGSSGGGGGGVEEGKHHSDHDSHKRLAATSTVVPPSPLRSGKVAKMGAGVLQAVGGTPTRVTKVGGPACESPRTDKARSPRTSSNYTPLLPLPSARSTAASKSPPAALFLSEEDEMAPPDPLVHRIPPKWSNQYHTDQSDLDTSEPDRRSSSTSSPHRRRRAKVVEATGTTIPPVSTPAPRTPSYSVSCLLTAATTAVSASAVGIPATLLLTTSPSTVSEIQRGRASVHFVSSGSAMVLLTAPLLSRLPHQHYLAFSTATEVVLAPLSDVVGAELDANCTGLFKLILDVSTTCGTARPPDPHSSLTGLFQASKGRAVAVVCKAGDTAQLADWLDALLRAKGGTGPEP